MRIDYGEPFVGKAGKLMNMAFQTLGIKREEVYIANIVKCRPPANRNPEEDECMACMNYLRNQVILVRPEIIVLFYYFTHDSINSIFTVLFVSIFAFVPIGITVFVSICPKLFDFIIGKV